MKTLKTVQVTPEWVEGYMPEFSTFKDNVIYISEQYKVAIHKCLCGCGEKVVTPLHYKDGWQIEVRDEGNVISMTPSIGNYQLPCKSHYIITKNKANFV